MALSGLSHPPSTPVVGSPASAPAPALPRPSWQCNTWQYVTLCAGIGSIVGIILYAVYFYPQRVDVPRGEVLAPAQRLTPPTTTAQPASPARSPQSSLSPAAPPAVTGLPESTTLSTPMLSVQPQKSGTQELPEPLSSVPSHLPMPPPLTDDNKSLSQDGLSHERRETTPSAPTSQASTETAGSSQADSTPPPKSGQPRSKPPLPKSGKNSRG
jgi:hypothetical protein